MSAPASVSEAVRAWTGCEHVVFVHSGSAALGLALWASGAGATAASVAVPALACWTLTQSVLEAGAQPRYAEVGTDLQATPEGVRATGADFAMSVAAWGAPCRLPPASPVPPRVADLTLSPLSAFDALAGAADFLVLSLGRGKPWDIGAGGILACADESLATEVRDRVQFGRRGLRWHRRGPRIVAAAALGEPALAAWQRLVEGRDAHIEARLAWEALSAGTALRPVPLAEPARAGVTAIVPHLLAPDFDLTGEDLYRVAIAERMPIGVQPVSPAYLEPAGADLCGGCPAAEALSDRLVFVSSAALGAPLSERLARFLDRVQANVARLRFPFGLPIDTPAAPLPEPYRRWAAYGVLCRGLDGSFRVLDTLTAKLFAVDANLATALAAAQAPAAPLSAARVPPVRLAEAAP
ncbi:MAG: DegT/DnrJ/EryC1/StrS family aminotransferase [Tistlia sp.]|uniref:DegT/DnrJ/EryC1/StrS family aminotransferase n=1 Tax=Tistlia sp. TaxID=3057121 RepID=UPI0034A415FD